MDELLQSWSSINLDGLAVWIADRLESLINPSRRISALPLLSAMLIAAAVFLWRRRSDDRLKKIGFLRYFFARSILKHRSTLVDIKIMLFNAVTKPASIFLMGLTVTGFAALVAKGLDATFGEPARSMPDAWSATLLLGAVIFLLTDLSTYITHRLSHEWKPLWAFHRVHHSAGVLNPFTLHRKHPLYTVLSKLVDLAMVAPAIGLVLYFWNQETGPAVALIVRWAFGIFALVGGNLRHSHVWLSFGPLERIFVSPAQHQLHHSRAERHWDCNYGEVLAIWDWMFGTLRPAAGRPERLRFGLAESRRQPHRTLVASLVEPFIFVRQR